MVIHEAARGLSPLRVIMRYSTENEWQLNKIYLSRNRKNQEEKEENEILHKIVKNNEVLCLEEKLFDRLVQ